MIVADPTATIFPFVSCRTRKIIITNVELPQRQNNTVNQKDIKLKLKSEESNCIMTKSYHKTYQNKLTKTNDENKP